MAKRIKGPWVAPPAGTAPQQPRTRGRATREQLLEQLAEARRAQDRERLGRVYGALMLAKHADPPGEDA